MIECKICNKEFKILGAHIRQSHKLITYKEYYRKYIDNSAGYCKMCNKETTLWSINEGFSIYCSSKCRSSDMLYHNKIKLSMFNKYGSSTSAGVLCIQNKIKKTCLLKYGVDNPAKSDIVKLKYKVTCLLKYGVENAAQSNIIKLKIKKTNLLRYGCVCTLSNELTKQKSYKTHLYKYGGIGFASNIIKLKYNKTIKLKYNIDNVNSLLIIKLKIKKTNLLKYGHSCALQNEEVHAKTIQTCLDKYKTSHPMKNNIIKNKIKNIMIDKYGGVGFQSLTIYRKYNETMLKKYGGISKQFLLRPYILNSGDTIYYQSIKLREYILYCELNDIFITNGDSISYVHDNTKRTYIIDFKIKNKLKYQLILIKGKHKWFYLLLDSGAFLAKVLAAQEYSKKNNYLPYKVVFV